MTDTPNTPTPAMIPTKKTGVPVQKRANLAEKAVQAVARGEVPVPVRKPPRAAPRPEHPVSLDLHTDIKVAPEVWKAARRIVENPEQSYSRIEVIDAETVIVR